jgi:hypothetical protein
MVCKVLSGTGTGSERFGYGQETEVSNCVLSSPSPQGFELTDRRQSAGVIARVEAMDAVSLIKQCYLRVGLTSQRACSP